MVIAQQTFLFRRRMSIYYINCYITNLGGVSAGGRPVETSLEVAKQMQCLSDGEACAYYEQRLNNDKPPQSEVYSSLELIRQHIIM